MEEILKIQKKLLWYSSKPEINHKTLCNTFEDRDLKNVDVKSKIIRLKCFWDKKLYHSNHHDWRILPVYFINKDFGKNFHFHSNLSFSLAVVDSFLEFYIQIFINWSNYFVSKYNKRILIDDKSVCLSSFSDKIVNFIKKLLDCLGNFKSWNVLKTEFKLVDSLYFSWM